MKPKKNENEQFKSRSLRILERGRRGTYDIIFAPELRLNGKWMEEWGFTFGKRVVVTHIEQGMLIRLVDEVAV